MKYNVLVKKRGKKWTFKIRAASSGQPRGGGMVSGIQFDTPLEAYGAGVQLLEEVKARGFMKRPGVTKFEGNRVKIGYPIREMLTLV